MNTDKFGNTTYVQDEGPGNGMWGLKPQKIGPTQVQRFQSKVGQMVWMKADRLLGVGREQVKLLSVDPEKQTAQVEVPEWGEETTPLYSLVPLKNK